MTCCCSCSSLLCQFYNSWGDPNLDWREKYLKMRKSAISWTKTIIHRIPRDSQCLHPPIRRMIHLNRRMESRIPFLHWRLDVTCNSRPQWKSLFWVVIFNLSTKSWEKHSQMYNKMNGYSSFRGSRWLAKCTTCRMDRCIDYQLELSEKLKRIFFLQLFPFRLFFLLLHPHGVFHLLVLCVVFLWLRLIGLT